MRRLVFLLSGAAGIGAARAAFAQAGSPGDFVVLAYNFALAIGAVIAFGVIVWGGVQYALAAGNPSRQSDARDRIWQALIGLVLLAGSYLVLYTINPALVNFQIESLSGIQGSADGACKPACEAEKGETCTPQGCQQCTLQCCPIGAACSQACKFDSAGNPTCDSCPSELIEECAVKGKTCAFLDGNPTCIETYCGNNGEYGPCQTGCTCAFRPGDPEPYYCVNDTDGARCAPSSGKSSASPGTGAAGPTPGTGGLPPSGRSGSTSTSPRLPPPAGR
jgi:hypothetical protein